MESNLDGQLVGLVVEDRSAAGEVEDLADIEARRDFEAVTTAVLRECIANLERIKEAIVQSIEAPLEPQVLDEVPYLLKGVTAGLLMLDRSRAVAAVENNIVNTGPFKFKAVPCLLNLIENCNFVDKL